MRKVGIYSTSGDKHTRLRNQMRRLFGCTVSLLYEDARGEATLNAPIARLTEFWWSERQPDARSLWESKIELGEDFFNEIIRCPIPIDLNTLRAMKRSPLGLDLYLWLTYRTFGLKRPLRLRPATHWPGTPYSISASGWPADSALIQARQRSQERYRPVASVSWRSTMGKVE